MPDVSTLTDLSINPNGQDILLFPGQKSHRRLQKYFPAIQVGLQTTYTAVLDTIQESNEPTTELPVHTFPKYPPLNLISQKTIPNYPPPQYNQAVRYENGPLTITPTITPVVPKEEPQPIFTPSPPPLHIHMPQCSNAPTPTNPDHPFTPLDDNWYDIETNREFQELRHHLYQQTSQSIHLPTVPLPQSTPRRPKSKKQPQISLVTHPTNNQRKTEIFDYPFTIRQTSIRDYL